MTQTFIACVGESNTEFVLYTNIVTRSSKFFLTAMARDWKESQEKRVTLPDIQASTFEGYLQWLNTGIITFAENPT
jgi:hypothetical protein